MLLSRFPRVHLAHLPTPLELMERLSEAVGGPNIYVKRDDCTGLAAGGNKTRKLEFLLGEAFSLGADTLITAGAVQSNHCRQTAAAAARFGMKCHLVFENRVADASASYHESGNVLLDRLFQAEMHHHPAGTDMDEAMAALADELGMQGASPYVIPVGGSSPVGAMGYANCALELVSQANDIDLVIDCIVHATGSSGTQAGLLAGLTSMNTDIPVLGIGVTATSEVLAARVRGLADATLAYLGSSETLRGDAVNVNCDYVGDGYGLPTEAMRDAVYRAARLEGLLFDPVYTGKALAGMLDLVEKGGFGEAENLVFIHTGGTPGLFGYQDQL